MVDVIPSCPTHRHFDFLQTRNGTLYECRYVYCIEKRPIPVPTWTRTLESDWTKEYMLLRLSLELFSPLEKETLSSIGGKNRLRWHYIYIYSVCLIYPMRWRVYRYHLHSISIYYRCVAPSSHENPPRISSPYTVSDWFFLRWQGAFLARLWIKPGAVFVFTVGRDGGCQAAWHARP